MQNKIKTETAKLQYIYKIFSIYILIILNLHTKFRHVYFLKVLVGFNKANDDKVIPDIQKYQILV